MPEHVDRFIHHALGHDPLIQVHYTDAVTRDSYALHYRSLYVHPCHRETVERLQRELSQPRPAP